MEVKLDDMSLKAKLPIWVFILVAGIGITIIFLLLQYRDAVFDEIKLQSIENAYWTKIIPRKDELSGWKTYRNEEYGFEVKYPSDWEYGLIYNAIWFGPKNLNLSTKAWVESGRFGICPQGCLGFGLEFLEPTSNELVIGGLKAERTDYKTGTGTTISIIKFLENKLPNSWSFIDQGFNLFFNSDEQANKFNQILSTFKFIEPVVWKTYRNEKYGFEVKYPMFNSKDRIQVEQHDRLGTIIEFENWDETNKIFFENFIFFVVDNPKKLPLQEWFAEHVDDNSILINKGVFRLITLHTGVEILRMQDVPLPSEYLDENGPLGTSAYIAPQSNEFIVGFGINGQVNNLDLHGFGGTDGYDALTNQILSTFKFLD